jgi:hypothetical protein
MIDPAKEIRKILLEELNKSIEEERKEKIRQNREDKISDILYKNKLNVMKNNPGTLDIKSIKDSIESIEFLTTQYKRKRLNTQNYIQLVHENLSKMTSERNYLEYLKKIGQQ